MTEVSQVYDDEIDLVELFQAVWDGKWAIVGAALISVLGVFGYQVTLPPPNFIATTEIKPISTAESERYRQNNSIGFFSVPPSLLLELYIEQLEERVLFEDAIRKYKLLDVTNYEDEIEFNEAVVMLASSIEISRPGNVDDEETGGVRRSDNISFEYNDSDKWRQVLSSVDLLANQAVKNLVQQQFRTTLSIAKRSRDFQLEDIATQIDNALVDYDREISNRLAYLREQAAIARTLGVAKNTIEAQTFSTQNGMMANVTTDTPFYLRGFEAIEKEIELIESRSNKEAFISGLLELEQNQRTLEQDRTLDRAESLFNTTPIVSDVNFSAVSVTVEASDFESQSKLILMLAAAVMLGGMLGLMYVLIATAIRNRKNKVE